MRAILLVLSTLAAACSKPTAPTLAPAKVAVQRVDLTGLALDISMSATNPNSVDLTASGVSSHVVIDKTHDIGTVRCRRRSRCQLARRRCWTSRSR